MIFDIVAALAIFFIGLPLAGWTLYGIGWCIWVFLGGSPD